MKKLGLLLLFLSACASRNIKPDFAPYPYGTYQHEVRVEIPADKVQKMDFRGVLQYTPEKLKLVGFSPIGTTLFRLTEDLKTKDLKSEFYLEGLQKAEPQLRRLYSLLREAYLNPTPTKEMSRSGTTFIFSEPNAENVPQVMELKHSRFQIWVKTVGYEK